MADAIEEAAARRRLYFRDIDARRALYTDERLPVICGLCGQALSMAFGHDCPMIHQPPTE